MTFLEFCDLMKIETIKKLEPETIVEIKASIKNNDTKLVGLYIKRKNDTYAPIIYMESFFKKYLFGSKIDELIEEMMGIINQGNPEFMLNTENYLVFEEQKDYIICRLINTEQNKELLSKVPHIDFLDLSIIFMRMVKNKAGEIMGTITIENRFLDEWKVDVNELYELAKENIKRELPLSIMTLPQLIPDIDEEIFTIISNSYQYYGAAVIMTTDVLETMSEELNADLFVIPSSIHEVLALPINSCPDFDELKEYLKVLIHDVNSSENCMKPDEILSDNLYLYSKDRKTLSIVE